MQRNNIVMVATALMIVWGQKIKAEILTVDPANCVIVTASATPDEDRFAARRREVAVEELAYHLKLVSGKDTPCIAEGDETGERFVFMVGAQPDGQNEALASQEARWLVSERGVWLYGDDSSGMYGTLNAVYDFLESELGVRWIEPGEHGIAYSPQAVLKLQKGEKRWQPRLAFRSIRQSIRKEPEESSGDLRTLSPDKPWLHAFPTPVSEHNAKVEQEVLWKRRMRMGGKRPGGAHAFSSWWGKYGASHPEYFALNKFGKREPVPLPKADQTDAFVKICPSNPGVVEQLIADWLPLKERIRYVDAGVNDGVQNFCECDNCRALDAPLEGENWDDHLTDRYVYLANAVAREARKHRPDAMVTIYAYMKTLYPPRRIKLEPNIVVQLVPYVDPLDLETVRVHFEGWRKAGATQLALRPNYHHKYLSTGLPLGIERRMFDVFQLAVSNGCVSADYDSATGHWALEGIMDYILAKAQSDTEQTFEYWEEHYCAAFGKAADVAKRYFRYWREEMWDKKLSPNLLTIAEKGRYGDFARGLLWNIKDYYSEADFDEPEAILQEAETLELNERERDRIEQLVLACKHGRMLVRTLTSTGQDGYSNTMALTDFRIRHKDILRLYWLRLVGWEARYINTNLQLAERLQQYPLPWLQTGMTWHFRMDPENRGLEEQWQNLAFNNTEDWERLRVDSFWEQAYRRETEPGLLERLRNYDGVAWYVSRLRTPEELRDKKILAVFGGVGDTIQFFVNGKKAGEYTVADEDSKRRDFTIRIDQVIDWESKEQSLTARVENRSGLGGLYNRIWIVSEE